MVFFSWPLFSCSVLRALMLLVSPRRQGFPHELEVRTSFPRFQEYFTLIVQFKGKDKDIMKNKEQTIARMYVGRYFTKEGEFDEVRNNSVSEQRRLSSSLFTQCCNIYLRISVTYCSTGIVLLLFFLLIRMHLWATLRDT
jgi:hypothetical protein